jgi:hypothetical protein
MKLRHIFLLVLVVMHTTYVNAQSVSVTSSASGNSICTGTSVTFTATPSGLSNPTYQWYKNNLAISGATASTYTTNNLTNNDAINVSATAATAGTIASSGLLFNLDAGNSSSYAGSGTTWNDISGNNYNTPLYNAPSYSSSNGGSLIFNGTNQYGLTPNIVNNLSQGTFIAWIKRNGDQGLSTSGYVAVIYSRYGGVPIGLNIVNNYLSITWNSLDYKFTLEGLLIPDNTWCMVALSIKPTQTNAYLFQPSGLTSGTVNTSTLPSASAQFKIGVDDCCSRYFKGNIGQAIAYNTALTTDQIKSIYNVNASRFGLTPFGTTISSNTITTTVNPLPPVNVTLIGDACANKSTLSATTGFSSYAWYKDNVAISGATSNTYAPTSTGDYKVQVSNGTCSNTSTPTTIYACAVGADGKMLSITNASLIISSEGGANFGTGRDIAGKLYNTTGLTTTSGTIGSSTAILGGVISPTNVVTSSVGIIYSADANFGTYTNTTIQSNIAAGTYTTTISGLSSLTTYYAKAFIVNKAGTSYGNVISFTTSSP